MSFSMLYILILFAFYKDVLPLKSEKNRGQSLKPEKFSF